ncbi:MAG: transglutaminase family protein [Verrucomicrobia bacterium]|nr:transglutaminase family protein [Verrucomicrobiota bacterium]
MLKHRQAIIRLLKDDDPETVLLTKNQLAQGGADTIADLRDLLNLDDEEVTFHIRDVLGEIESREAKQRLEVICRGIRTQEELEEACWLLAQVFLPGVEISHYNALLSNWARTLRERMPAGASDLQQTQILTHLMSRELGFHGNSDDYYNVKNSLLPCVIDSRVGIPISLSVLYIAVARRAAVTVEGINLPGHFVVRLGSVLFDPFHEGRMLTPRDCAEILARQSLTLESVHLQTASPRLVLMRMLANLLYIFEGEDDNELHQQMAAWIRLLDPK